MLVEQQLKGFGDSYFFQSYLSENERNHVTGVLTGLLRCHRSTQNELCHGDLPEGACFSQLG